MDHRLALPADKPIIAMGTMAGTSLDGIDIAAIITDGDAHLSFGPTHFMPYPATYRGAIQRAIKAALEGRDAAADIEAAERLVTDAHARAIEDALTAWGDTVPKPDLIGFHGQTIYHRAPSPMEGIRGRTWQLGDAKTLANRLGIPVVARFRHADIDSGGQGAPLAPIYHYALLTSRRDASSEIAASANPPSSSASDAVAVVNIGGVANMTFVHRQNIDTILAFDTGPGNGLIDQLVEETIGARCDQDGRLALQGIVDQQALRLLLLNPYFKRLPPKSLDRYDFKLSPIKHLSLEDAVATLTEFTAASLRLAINHLPAPPEHWVICGGGRHNPALMAALSRHLPGRVRTAEEEGWRGDFIEAECFGYLATRAVRGRSLTLPGTTGTSAPLSGGELYLPK